MAAKFIHSKGFAMTVWLEGGAGRQGTSLEPELAKSTPFYCIYAR